MAHKVPPKVLPGFPNAVNVKPKTHRPGGGLRNRWKDVNGDILEWDYRHGAVERYDPQGRHLGEYDADTGVCLKPPVSTRRIEP